MQNLIIIGTSSTAEHVYKFINEYQLFNVIGFAIDSIYINQNSFFNLPIYAIEKLETVIDKEKDLLFIALLWNRLNADRRKLYENLKSQGYKFANIISPTAKIRGNLIGDNCWFHDYTIVQHDAEIGANVMVMAHSLIGAHVKIQAHCFLGTKCTIGGNCTIGEQTFIGINSTIFDDRSVGEKCIVGACTTVKRDLPNFSSCTINIDNLKIKSYPEDIIESKLMFSKNIR